MWGGRFAEGPSALMREINASIAFDKRLWRQDIAASRAHVAMLARPAASSARRMPTRSRRGSTGSRTNMRAGGVAEDAALEDIHMHVEHRLAELIGPAAGRLHTARSRNDQVATDFRLWVRDAIDEADGRARRRCSARWSPAPPSMPARVMPGFTHLQAAQPVTLGHHLMAYYEMLRRDRSRFADARARLNECPLGAAALAGTGFPIDREATALALGFDRPTANSLDAVSDRDFALDYLMAATQCALHLSRLAEEFILWASQPFGFVTLADAFSTGSSIMPQKRNPDAAELVRGHSGPDRRRHDRAGDGDEGPAARLFEGHAGRQGAGVRGARSARPVARGDGGHGRDRRPSTSERMRAAAEAGHATATDLADWLVREAGVPFREAHHITGRAVRLADERGVPLWELPLDALQARRRADRRGRFRMCFRSTHRLRAGPASAAPRRRR